MGTIVLKALQAGSAAGGSGGGGGIAQQVVGMAEAATQISALFRQQAEANKNAARADDNEFNIRKNFLDNAVAAIRDATLSQYNIVICTDQAHDDFQNLQGRLLPMDLLDVEIAPGKFVNFEVYVFDTGKYLRRGKWEGDSWSWWGETKKFTDIFMHVHFETAQKKLNPDEAKKAKDDATAKDKAAADAAAAAKASQDASVAEQAATLKEADQKAADAATAAAAKNGQPGQAAAPVDPNAPASGGQAGAPPVSQNPNGSGAAGASQPGQYPGAPANGSGRYPNGPGASGDPRYGAPPAQAPGAGGSQFPSPSAYGNLDQRGGGPAPSLTSHLVRAAAGPAMQMMMPALM